MLQAAGRRTAPLVSSLAIKDWLLIGASADACKDEGVAGKLLVDLERRQDDVLAQLDALDQQLSGLLRGLGVTLTDDESAEASPTAAHQPPDDEAADHDGDDAYAQKIRLASRPADAEDAGDPMAAATGFAKLPCDRPTANNAAHSRAHRQRSPEQTRAA